MNNNIESITSFWISLKMYLLFFADLWFMSYEFSNRISLLQNVYWRLAYLGNVQCHVHCNPLRYFNALVFVCFQMCTQYTLLSYQVLNLFHIPFQTISIPFMAIFENCLHCHSVVNLNHLDILLNWNDWI